MYSVRKTLPSLLRPEEKPPVYFLSVLFRPSRWTDLRRLHRRSRQMILTPETKERLLKQLQGLRELTTARGCTEAEALSAAEKCQELMDKYGFTASEIRCARVDICEEESVSIGKDRMHEVSRLARVISEYTDTKGVFNCKWKPDEGVCRVTEYFGFPADVQVAIYLTNVFREALDREWASYWKIARKQNPTVHGRTARLSFMKGMVHSIRARLKEKIKERESARQNASTSRELMCLKAEVVDRAWEEKWKGWPKRKTHTYTRSYGDYDAFSGGVTAGQSVGIPSGAIDQRSKPSGLLV
jgi:hypothetical protein